jgi:predicted RNA polymerase sigma factor
VTDEVAAPKLICTQPDLTPNKRLAMCMRLQMLVSQYKYDDVIEAYVVSSDEAGNFFKSISFQTLATATTPLPDLVFP